MKFDAEGHYLGETCPRCGSTKTITYEYDEGFTELECQECGYTSEAPEIDTGGTDANETPAREKGTTPEDPKTPSNPSNPKRPHSLTGCPSPNPQVLPPTPPLLSRLSSTL